MAGERGAEIEAALPVDAEAALAVDLAVLPAAGMLSAIHDAKRSGLVLFRQRQHEKRIYLDAGEVIFASSNQAVDRLGECLLRSGAITLEELRAAERTFKVGDRFGRVLVECGVLTPRELWNGVRNQVEEIVRSLFAAPTGRLWFWEGEIRPDNVVRLSLETARLISEGQQRCAELRRFLTVLDDPRVQLAQTGLAASPSLAESERAIYDAVQAGRAFADVVAELGVDRESAARSVQLLRLVGGVKLMRLPEQAPTPPRDPVLVARAEALVKLITVMAAEISAADCDRSVRARLARELHDVAGRFPALLAGVEIAEEGEALEAGTLAERASRLPDEGGDVLAAALGELVTYLEFELMNHPKVGDPAGFLRGLEPLRRAAAS
jgi:Domain of unknown function (DUF4388)